MTDSVFSDAVELVSLFTTRSWRLVLAESCTCGMAAAAIGGVPGASEVFCGSAVTYRERVKSQWLDVDPETLRQFTAESQETTDEMADRVLRRTDEATFGAAITGHLGPGAPPEKDGRVFVSLCYRPGNSGSIEFLASEKFVLFGQTRQERQVEAARVWITWILLRTKPLAVALKT